MGAGSSSEQRSPEQPEAGGAPLAEPEAVGGDPSVETPSGALEDPVAAPADSTPKLLQKNGQLSTVNSLAEQGELSLQEGEPSGQEEDVIVTDVGQRESEDVSEKDSDKEMAANSAVVQDITEDEQEETPEKAEQIPSSENNVEELTQPTESQSNDVGFKKVFKFVGFKFTVKKDKSEKSDSVQLLTVKKDDVEGTVGSNGAGDHQESSLEAGGAAPKDSELQQSTEKAEETAESEPGPNESALKAESGQVAEEGKEEGEEKQEKEPSRSAESPASPTANETASPFKKFFTQGWAGWRKKTSFRKPKEEELDSTEKKKEQEPEKVDTEDGGKTEDAAEKPSVSEQPPSQEKKGLNAARLSAEYEKIELPTEEQVGDLQGPSEEKTAPLATEVFDEKVEIVAEVHVSTEEETTEEQKAEVEEAAEALPPEKTVERKAELQEAELAEDSVKAEDLSCPGEEHPQPAELSPEEKASSKHPDGIVNEAEMLSAQERTKVQGSPLKKLFTSTGLKKLSGKKQKGKRGGEEESGDHSHLPAESPDSTDEQKGESSASSPEEPEEITCLEKGVTDAQPDGEVEEGPTSDGERKREGVTPWASFKKMVTPKKRVRRPSESDREDELEKVKSATMSSTESAASELQDEVKGNGEEPKPEEPKRKVDTSVSWEALICVGSSKKRARKGSSSDEEGGPRTTGGDSQKMDEAGKDKETGADSIPTNSQDHDQGQGSSSPEQAGSPSEGEGVSTWESFKRLVTARKKSKSKMEEKSEDTVTGSGVEHSASDVEPGKEESWVSIKKFIPGRRKKRLDGKQEQAAAEDTGTAEVNEDDSDVPAVVPLSEYDAVEREKMEAQETPQSEDKPEQTVAVHVSEELSKTLVHTVTTTVVDGMRAVTSIEERSPSWISASVTPPLEQAEDDTTPLAEAVLEGEASAEVPTVAETVPESKDTSDSVVAGGVELTSKTVTVTETTEALCAEEVTEASAAEETTEMVSAVSQLSESADTTEEATPVQEVEGDRPDLEDLGRRTHEVLQAVAEKVKEESQLPDASGQEDITPATQEVESEIPEKVGEAEGDSKKLDPKKEVDVGLTVHVQETETEDFLQTTPESSEKVPQAPQSLETTGRVSPSQVETVAGVESQELPKEQAVTLTDTKTSGSAPVADFETPSATQEEKMKKVHEEGEAAPAAQLQLARAEPAPAQKEMPPFPSSFQSQEDSQEQAKMEEAVEGTDREVPVEAAPILPKTEVIPETHEFLDEKSKGTPFAEGLEVSAGREIAVTQEKVAEAVCEGEVTEEAELQKDTSCSASIELQSHTESLSTPEERDVVAQAKREKTEAEPTHVCGEKLEGKTAAAIPEELSEQPVQTVTVTVVDGEEEGASLEDVSPSCLVQRESVSTKIQVSEASLPVAAVEEKVVGETVTMLETGAEALASADAHFGPEGEASDKDADFPAQLEADAVPTRPESQAASVPVTVSAPAEKEVTSDPEGDKTTAQKGKPDEDHEQVVCEEITVSVMPEEDSKAEKEVLEIESESSKLVQNIIQTAVDQLVSTDEAATQVVIADSRDPSREPEKEEREPHASAQDETRSAATEEESELTTVVQTHPDTAKDEREASPELLPTEMESCSVSDRQPPEAVVLPSEGKADVAGTRAVPAGDERASAGERLEKPLLESTGAEKGDAVDYTEDQPSVLEDTNASGELTKESPDANGPKRKKKEDVRGEVQEGKVQSESEKEIETQPQEETHKQETESAKSELTESSDVV